MHVWLICSTVRSIACRSFWKGKQDHHQKMTSLEKAIVEADEKVGLILMLQNGTLIRPLPEDGSVEPVSDI